MSSWCEDSKAKKELMHFIILNKKKKKKVLS